jgi:2,5-diamino-6-(ribosylamino)-4(3H)-pyrimidinone 5'-phosphate reductase
VSALPRPFVTANFALTADGRTTTRKFTPSDFSTPRDKHRLLEIRATCDAILVGGRTLAADQMSMGLPDAALRAGREKAGKSPYPLRVIVSNRGRLSPEWKVFSADLPPPIVFTTRQMPTRTISALTGRCDLYLHLSEAVNLAAALATLREDYGVKRLVCEGGGTLLRALLELDLVDELHATLCPQVFGGKGAPTLTGVAGAFLPKAVELRLAEMAVEGAECFTRWKVRRK